MTKKARKKRKGGRARNARTRTPSSVVEKHAPSGLGADVHAFEQVRTSEDSPNSWSRIFSTLARRLTDARSLRDWLSARDTVSTVKSFRNLHVERQHIFIEILVSCSLPLPEITSFVKTYVEDDERALREDWESIAFDLYLTAFYLFRYWQRQNNRTFESTSTRQFQIFHTQMQELYLKNKLSAQLAGRISKLEHL